VRSSRVLIRPREPAFWVYVALLVVTAAGTFAQQSSFRRISPGGWALSWVLLLLYAAPVFILIYLLDLYEREPIPLLLASFVWGAIVATQLAGFANAGWGLVVARVGGPEFASQWTAALTAPLVEETLKGLGVVMIVLIARREVDDMMDGFVYGAVCGLGFAVVEDVFYFIGVFGGSTSDVLRGFFVRVVASGFYGHVLYTGLVGMGIGYFVSRRSLVPARRRFGVLAALCAAAVAGHFIWNSPLLDFYPSPPWTGVEWLLVVGATAAKGLPLLVFVVVAVALARGRERRWLRSALAPEVGGSALSRIELDLLENPARRRRSRREMKLRAGAAAATLLRRLQHEQIRLAVARTRADGAEASRSADASEVAVQRELCTALRAALLAMPGAMPAGSLEPGHGGHR
jgi:RsiW-degrading membrane proteinase PrsW (M82 family)